MSARFLFTLILLATLPVSGAVLIPAAADSPGPGGARWTTDLTIHNASDLVYSGDGVSARVTLEVIPSGLSGWAEDRQAIDLPETLPPGMSVTLPDVLGTYFPGVSSGALIVHGADTEGQSVPLLATSRTWTPETDPAHPDRPGTYGQGLPGISLDENPSLTEEAKTLAGLAFTPEIRSNVGVVNASLNSRQTFRFTVLDEGGDPAGELMYTLEPWSHYQINGILNILGLEGTGYSVRVERTARTDLGLYPNLPSDPTFAIYGSRIDRRTSDPFTLSWIPSGVARETWKGFMIPAAAHKPGGDDSDWRTDLMISHPGEEGELYIMIELIPTGPEGAAVDLPYTFILDALAPGTSLEIDDVLGTYFPDTELAALVVTGYDENFEPADLSVVSRTWTPGGDPDTPGTYGQGIPGESWLDADTPRVIMGLEESDRVRSNLGLVNASLNLRETFTIDVYDKNGGFRATIDYTLEPWAHLQVNNILSDLGLTGEGYSAVVRVSGTENLFLNPSESWEPDFFCYASRVDRETNDPYFLTGFPVPPAPENPPLWYDFDAQTPWHVCPPDPIPEEATVVTAVDREFHYFAGYEDNKRSIHVETDFPPAQAWNQVGLMLILECPESGLCDHWDRNGHLDMVLNPEAPEEEWEYIELARYITPYRLEMCFYIDVTHLAPLLHGHQVLRTTVDTWIGPGSSYGDGWRVTARFVFYPGPWEGPAEIRKLWTKKTIVVGYLEEDKNVDSQIDPMPVSVPEDAVKVEAWFTSTGHSFGNTYNCAEFCIMRNDLYVNGVKHSFIPWRNDCERNPVSPQYGTWKYDRNGWCPGAPVLRHVIDITEDVVPGGENLLDFDIRMYDGEEYHNTEPADWDPNQIVSLTVLVYR